jgi:hypothetical protein
MALVGNGFSTTPFGRSCPPERTGAKIERMNVTKPTESEGKALQQGKE